MRRPNRRPSYLDTGDIGNWEDPYNYIVYKEDADTVIRNGDTGKEGYRNTISATAIQWAIDNLTSGRSVIETIMLKGDFETAAALRLADYTKIILDGRIKLADNADCHIIDTAANNYYWEWVGGELDGNKANNAGNIDGFNLVARPRYGFIRDVNIHNCKRHGIYAEDGYYNGVMHSQITGCDGSGVHIDGEHFEILDNWIGGHGVNGIHAVAGSTHTRIIGNLSASNTLEGIKLECNHMQVIGNSCGWNTRSGINIGSTQNIIIGNRCNNNTWYGINCSNDEHTIIGNTCYDNGAGTRDGIILSGSNNICANNTIEDSDGSHTVTGIEITGNDNIVNGNNIENMITNVFTDAGARNIINNLGTNAAVPGVGGNWATATREGVIVRDTANNKTYIYAGAGWREISAA